MIKCHVLQSQYSPSQVRWQRYSNKIIIRIWSFSIFKSTAVCHVQWCHSDYVLSFLLFVSMGCGRKNCHNYFQSYYISSFWQTTTVWFLVSVAFLKIWNIWRHHLWPMTLKAIFHWHLSKPLTSNMKTLWYNSFLTTLKK